MTAGHLRIDNVSLARGEDGTASGRFAAWNDSAREGFYHKPATPAQQEQMLQALEIDARVLTGVYDDARPAGLVDPLVPVATYASFAKTLNAGAGLLPAHLITLVTVRPTHRRRGILRELMTADLARAKDNGFPVAALTATEATIYGRFGFGRVTEHQELQLDVRGEVRFHADPVGSVIQLAPEKLADIAGPLFERFHATRRGSVGRQESYLRHATARWGEDGPEPDAKLRAAVYLDAAGEIQGYVTYAFAGWEPAPITLNVRDLVATTEVARRELFRFLAAHDLVERVSYPFAAADDPLGWALEDPARVRFAEREHGLWVRVLEVPEAFAARAYRGAGNFTLRVDDALGLAAGTYGFEVAQGRAAVTRLDDDAPADLSCDAVALGPLLLSAAGIGQLHAAGLLRIPAAGEPERLSALLDLPGLPHAINGF